MPARCRRVAGALPVLGIMAKKKKRTTTAIVDETPAKMVRRVRSPAILGHPVVASTAQPMDPAEKLFSGWTQLPWVSEKPWTSDDDKKKWDAIIFNTGIGADSSFDADSSFGIGADSSFASSSGSSPPLS